VYFRPLAPNRSATGVLIGPPKALEAPNPTSWIRTISTLGGPFGGRSASIGGNFVVRVLGVVRGQPHVLRIRDGQNVAADRVSVAHTRSPYACRGASQRCRLRGGSPAYEIAQGARAERRRYHANTIGTTAPVDPRLRRSARMLQDPLGRGTPIPWSRVIPPHHRALLAHAPGALDWGQPPFGEHGRDP
jgi:hypothetical protein